MRINHNIAALNTYRQLSSNQGTGAKSLEKLSSGLRINRAGDDAAGLAISEKMRAQIRGLDQASRNAQDGISLIQTAEGALNETHSILQRMRELANQAATDTNVDVDREEIQKEINQLTSEINRIGNTTQFNTRTLLNGDVNVIDGVTAKLTGGEAGNSFNIIDAATKGTATGAVTNEELEFLAETGSTVTGTKAYDGAVGPNTNMTSATVTGTALTGDLDISDGDGKIVTGTKIYTDPSQFNSGPKVERTVATATGTSLTGQDNLVISDVAGVTMTGTKEFANGPNVTDGDNELTVTLNGDTKTIVLTAANYAGNLAGFAEDLQTELNDGGAFGAGTFSVGIDAQDRIVITALGDNNGEAHELSIDGGGIRDLLLDNPVEDAFTPGTQAVNNTIEINSKFANGNPDSTRVVVLENAAYDIGVPGDKTALLADINNSLGAAQIIGENAISTSADLTVHADTEVNITIVDNGTTATFTMDQAAIQGLFDGTQTAQEVADAINGLDNGSGVDFTDVAKAIVHDGKLVITSNTGATASTAQFAITDGTGGTTDLTAVQDAFGINHMDDAVTGADDPAVEADFDANNKLVFTSTDDGAGAEVNINGGLALTSLGLENAVEVAGTENNELVISFDGGVTTAKISLTEEDYSSGNDESADSFAADIQAAIRGLDADALGLNGVTNAQLDAIEVTINNEGKVEFNTKDSGVQLTMSAGVASSGAVDVDTTGKDVVFNAGKSGSEYNNISVEVVADGDNVGNSASMSGNVITVNIGTGTIADDAITTADLQALIRGASDATVDLSNFTVSGDDTITKQDWEDEGAIKISGGTDNAGGLESLLKADPSDQYDTGTEVEVNNQITLTAQGIERTITLSDATYDLDTEEGQNALVADIQTQLDEAFSAGVVTASFDGGLVFTNNVDGTTSTFGETVTGSGAATLGLDGAEVVQGGEFNKLTVTYEGQTETLDLAIENYDGSAGKTTDDFLADIQAKLNTAFGDGNIIASLNNANKIMFTTKEAGEEISIDGGGAANHLLAEEDTIDDLVVNLSGEVDRTMTITVGENTGEIELAAGTYDLNNADSRAALLDDINTKLETAFGEGAVTADFATGESGYRLVLTNNTEGSESAIGATITGGAAEALGMDEVEVYQGEDTNNEVVLTVDGHAVNISLTGDTYTGAEMAKEIQNQIRVQGVRDDAATLQNATVSFQDNAFVIQSGAEGASGSVVAADGVLGDLLGLTSEEATITEGVDAVEDALKLQIGANTGQSMSLDINDMRANALGVTSKSATAERTVEVEGKQYEVAWTASESVTNGTDNNEVEFALDVSTHDNATAAVKVINDAIESVSAERSKLGAYQNRLEHTINNLGTSAENLTAAESRIRDVDMAKEMMEFTKNNILAQAAQSMLAQANQQPQQVLQLLR